MDCDRPTAESSPMIGSWIMIHALGRVQRLTIRRRRTGCRRPHLALNRGREWCGAAWSRNQLVSALWADSASLSQAFGVTLCPHTGRGVLR